MRLLSAGPAVSTAVTAARPQPGSHLRPLLALATALAGGLALTGADIEGMATIGAGALVVGGLMVRRSRRLHRATA